MRQPYETPEIVPLGSVSELTQAFLIGPTPDHLGTIISLPGINVPGDSFS